MSHTLMMSEQGFSTGTWSGAILSGFTFLCGSCRGYSVVQDKVVERGGLYDAKSCRDLTCPYCGTKDKVDLDNGGRILPDVTWHGED